jgi:hypothetical protein
MTIESLAIIFAPTCIHITQQETVPKKVFLQKAKRLFKKKKQTYQDLLQLDLIKDNVKWTKLFELILSDPSIFANLTNNKIKSPPMLPIMLEKTVSVWSN